MIVNKNNFKEAMIILDNALMEVWSIDLETYNPLEGMWFKDLTKKQTPLNRMCSKIVSLQLATHSGIEMYFDFNHKQDGEDLRLPYDSLLTIFAACRSKELIAHNAGFEYTMLKLHGQDLDFFTIYDTMIMGVLYNENMPQGLKGLIKTRFDYQMHSYADTVGTGTMKDLTAEQGYAYGMDDSIWTLKLFEWLAERIDMDYYLDFEEPLIPIIAQHYIQGQRISEDKLNEVMAEDLQERDVILNSLPENSPLRDLNINSPKQVSNYFYNVLGLKPHKVSKKTGMPSTDKESIYHLINSYGKTVPEIEAFGKLKAIDTRMKLYYKPYPKLVYPDGKLHSEIRQTGTVTGRFSMNSPNLQQVAKRGEGKKVRNIIVPFREHDCIVSIDWSQIELRIAAHMSNDEKLIDAYTHDKDLHTVSGTNISGDSYDDMVKKIHEGDVEAKKARQAGKTLNFAALYLAGAKRLAGYDLLNCSEAEAEQFLTAHKAGYRGYFYDYVNEIKQQLIERQYVKTMFGRTRHLVNAVSAVKVLQKEAFNQGLNFTIQGSAAELMKAGLISLYEENLLYRPDFTFIAPVHDEYVFSADSKSLPELLPKVVKIMERTPVGFKIPIKAAVSLGKNFGDQHELEEFTSSMIERVLNEQ